MAQQNINSATAATTITGSDSVFISKNDNALQKIDYDLLAKAIIEQYTGSTLGGSARSLKTAIDALNSNLQLSLQNSTTEREVSYAEHLRLHDEAGHLPLGKPFLARIQFYEKGVSACVGYLYEAGGTHHGGIAIFGPSGAYFCKCSQSVWTQNPMTTSV